MVASVHDQRLPLALPLTLALSPLGRGNRNGMASTPGKKDGSQDSGVATDVRTRKQTEQQTKRPRLYKVILHNDDYTTMEFVVSLLQFVFHHSDVESTAIMLNIHRTGIGIAGVYTYEIAETKVAQVMEYARKAEYPLQCTMEPE